MYTFITDSESGPAFSGPQASGYTLRLAIANIVSTGGIHAGMKFASMITWVSKTLRLRAELALSYLKIQILSLIQCIFMIKNGAHRGRQTPLHHLPILQPNRFGCRIDDIIC